jgi:hypothetical protein
MSYRLQFELYTLIYLQDTLNFLVLKEELINYSIIYFLYTWLGLCIDWEGRRSFI